MIETTQPKVGTAASIIAQVPAGPCTIIIGNNSGQVVYVGGSAVTATSGYPVPSGSFPVTVPGYTASAATTLYGVAGSAVTVGVIISTDG